MSSPMQHVTIVASIGGSRSALVYRGAILIKRPHVSQGLSLTSSHKYKVRPFRSSFKFSPRSEY
eukprot:scaffold73496_cov66-Phaeocystis_antarctica.AAC.3